MTVGTWNPELHAEYRALPPGPRKRALASRLIVENEPLVKTLVSQLLGRGEPTKRRTAATRMGGKGGFHAIPFEDAMQAGRFALSKALDSYDPSKGGISIHLAFKVRYELQRTESYEHLARAPQDKEHLRPALGLVGLPSVDDDARGAGSDERGYFTSTNRHEDLLESATPAGGKPLTAVRQGFDWEAALDAATPEQVSEWGKTGEWPESLEAWATGRATAAPTPKKAWSFPSRPAAIVVLTGLDLFVQRCTLATHGRIDVATAYNAYRIECRLALQPELSRSAFVRELSAGWDVRETWCRAGKSTARVLAGLRVQTAA